MTPKSLTQEQAIEYYTELQRRVQVGAYVELQHDGSFPEDDGSPESTTLESLANLETWAEKQGLAFSYDATSRLWSLMSGEEPPDLVVEQMNHIESPSYNEPGEDEWYYQPPEDEADDGYEVSGDGSGLHQCPWCYDLVYEDHDEFCPLNPDRNREIVP